MKRVLVLPILLLPLAAAADTERPAAGAIFAQSRSGTARLFEQPDPGSKLVASPPNGTRLVFRKQMVDGGGTPTWYFVTPPGRPAGWVLASEVSDTRPGDPPKAKIIPTLDSGMGVERPTAAQTAAARGLSESARNYAATKGDLKKAVDEFVTLEKVVEDYFQDPHDPTDGSYPDVTVPGRKKKAEEFKAGLK